MSSSTVLYVLPFKIWQNWLYWSTSNCCNLWNIMWERINCKIHQSFADCKQFNSNLIRFVHFRSQSNLHEHTNSLHSTPQFCYFHYVAEGGKCQVLGCFQPICYLALHWGHLAASALSIEMACYFSGSFNCLQVSCYSQTAKSSIPRPFSEITVICIREIRNCKNKMVLLH